MGTKTIYLAGGCFWGCQKYFDLMPGVMETEVGYANGPTADPSYEQVKAHAGHAHGHIIILREYYVEGRSQEIEVICTDFSLSLDRRSLGNRDLL